jgi:hypothetical protein
MASLLHKMKTNIEEGFTIDIRILMNSIAAIFPFCEKPKEPETIQSALMAHSVHGQQRTTFRDSDDTQPKWKKEKSQKREDNAILHLTNEMDKTTKAMNDFKSDLGMIKQHIFSKPTHQPTHGGRQFQNQRNFPQRPGRGQGPNSGNHGHQQPPPSHATGETQTAYTAYKSGAGPSFQQRRIIDSAEEDDSQQFANLASMAAQPSRTDYSIVRLINSVSRKRRSITPDRYNSPAPSSTGISGFFELDMHEDDSRQLDFNSMAAYHVDHLIDAKTNSLADPYQIIGLGQRRLMPCASANSQLRRRMMDSMRRPRAPAARKNNLRI